MIDASVITVSWNVKEHLEESLEALFKSDGVSYEVIVVDNNSDDSTQEFLLGESDKLTAILNQNNRGFAAANNQGISMAKGRYILLLNPDMKVHPDSLRLAVEWMDKNPQVGVSGCRLVDENGDVVPHVRRFPKLFDQLMIILKIPHLLPRVLDRYLMADFDYDKAAQVDSVRGSFFLIRAGVLKTCRLDERFFVWFEEVDFCRQAIRQGWDVWYSPAATVVDKVGQSFKQISKIRAQRIFLQSMFGYFKKWGI